MPHGHIVVAADMPGSEPFLLFEARKLDDDALVAAGERYAVRLQHIAA
ncbi:hypothetical protein [Cupriavidus basilensis]|nr:hypothetical protein [Cupriavidus basilensis]